MGILEASDLTRCAHSAAAIVGCDPKTVARYVARRDAGHDPHARVRRPMKIDPYRAKVEELVERSKGRIRADVVHERLEALGFDGHERTTRRAVRVAKAAYRAGRRRTYRLWVTEPGMWLQSDWAKGPMVDARPTQLFCAWLACLDATLRAIGGAPTYLLTDNERTISVDRVAGVAVRHPEIVAAGRHYGCEVHACVPYDPEFEGRLGEHGQAGLGRLGSASTLGPDQRRSGRSMSGSQLMPKQRPTRRQLEVLRAYIRAGSVAAAAYELGISETTVRQHLSGLYRRTELSERGAGGVLAGPSRPMRHPARYASLGGLCRASTTRPVATQSR